MVGERCDASTSYNEIAPMPLLDPIPSPVAHADLVALEWEPLLALVAGFASSPVGRAAIVALAPSTDEAWIARQHRLTGEVRLLIEEQVSIPLGGLFDPTQLAAKAQIPEAALEAAELQSVARLAHDIAAWQGLLRVPDGTEVRAPEAVLATPRSWLSLSRRDFATAAYAFSDPVPLLFDYLGWPT